MIVTAMKTNPLKWKWLRLVIIYMSGYSKDDSKLIQVVFLVFGYSK